MLDQSSPSSAQILSPSSLMILLLLVSALPFSQTPDTPAEEVHADRVLPVTEYEHGLSATLPGQGSIVTFDGRGLTVEPSRGDWSWGLELESYGYRSNPLPVGESPEIEHGQGDVRYTFDDFLEEWFKIDSRGLEHGFTLTRSPEEGEGPLEFTMRVRGGLTPKLSLLRKDVQFTNDAQDFVLGYRKLQVFDSDDRNIPAWFELDGERLRICVNDLDARYPLIVDPIVQTTYVKAPNPGQNDRLGFSLDISGTTMVVSATGESSSASGINGNQLNNSASAAGAAYVLVRSGGVWEYQAYVKASNPSAGDLFGRSAAISGDIMVISAPLEDSNATGVNGSQFNSDASDSGAAYVFVRNGTDWSQEAYLKASNTTVADGFGTGADIDGDTIVVGAPSEDGGSTGVNGDGSMNLIAQSGAAYVFVRNGSSWNQQAYLKASNTGAFDNFGYAVAVSGDTIVVGARFESSNAPGIDGDQSNDDATSAGAAYVFVREGTTWSQQAYLKASNAGEQHRFGHTVAICGDTIAIAAIREDSAASGINADPDVGTVPRSGAVYIFQRTGTQWEQQAYVKPRSPLSFAEFGNALSLDGDLLVVGAEQHREEATGVNGEVTGSNSNEGVAFVFLRTGTTWNQLARLNASELGSKGFGSAVGVAEDIVAVGARAEDSGSSLFNGDPTPLFSTYNSGAAYIFEMPIDVSAGLDHCLGDGGDQVGCTPCPCGNEAAVGVVGGCLNSVGSSARLIASGSASVSSLPGSADDLRFALVDGPPSVFALLTSGEALAPSNSSNPCFGLNSGIQFFAFDGLRCVVGGVLRHGTRAVDLAGTVGSSNNAWGGESGPDVGIATGFTAGSTRFFQVTYRDDPSLACMRALNTSQAVEISFTP